MKPKYVLYILFIYIFLSVNIAQASSVVTDAAITVEVKSKIALEKSLSVFSIGVTTKNKVVALSGNVDSQQQAANLVQIVQSVSGVTDIDISKLKIKEYRESSDKQPFTDAVITAKIKGLFIQNKLFNSDKDIAAMSIKVETKNGVVSLSGTADNLQQVDNAVSIARSVKGVEKVESTITVSP